MSKENKGGKPEDSKNEKLVSLVVVVNTIPVNLQMNENASLKALVEKALAESHNTGRNLSEWELKLNDQILDLDRKLKDYNLRDHQELFLSLRAGAGGHKRSVSR